MLIICRPCHQWNKENVSIQVDQSYFQSIRLNIFPDSLIFVYSKEILTFYYNKLETKKLPSYKSIEKNHLLICSVRL